VKIINEIKILSIYNLLGRKFAVYVKQLQLFALPTLF